MWQGLIGSILLYGAFLVHGGLGFAAFYQRRFYGLTLLDVAQLVLGLAISALLANHLADTRLALLLYGLPKRYSRVLITFWVLERFPPALNREGFPESQEWASLPPSRFAWGANAEAVFAGLA